MKLRVATVYACRLGFLGETGLIAFRVGLYARTARMYVFRLFLRTLIG